ncbi:unnamed protein product [Fusarium graminearum]|uniref:Chromosome 1, complete genome n=1 Tax=Gibberella zeae (strain ATCC MYA-4620 / CBS 123657 / FGSC 9075 / NRRL 31084 / PH-1) TaxID=229533 RepID=A0A098DAK7_GIBZE|nr:unnamed protein product [Fusarium graminearum]CZS79244.1 unnamed protein product [Fusarium graminearum]
MPRHGEGDQRPRNVSAAKCREEQGSDFEVEDGLLVYSTFQATNLPSLPLGCLLLDYRLPSSEPEPFFGGTLVPSQLPPSPPR